MDAHRDMVTVDLVYDLASQIGDQFKKLIENNGAEANEPLIPCVVRVLEHLEVLVMQRDAYRARLDELTVQMEDLQREQREKAQRHIKFQSEMEDADECWRKENHKLTQLIQCLEKENSRLLDLLHSQGDECLPDDSVRDTRDDSCLTSNAELIAKLNACVRSLDKDVEARNQQIDQLTGEVDSLERQNHSLRQSLACLKPECGEVKPVEVSPTGQSDSRQCQVLQNRIAELERQLTECRLTSVPRDPGHGQDDNLNNNGEDLPVQGPIPQEPDDKFFFSRSSNNSGSSKIWSFFPRLTKALIK